MKTVENMTCAEKLSHSGASYRLNGIVECLDKGKATSSEISLLEKLETDETVLGGRTISTYAKAALDILGVKKYLESDESVSELIGLLQ